MEKKKTIYIDMFLDLICEWCFLGKGVLDSMKDRGGGRRGLGGAV